MSPRASQEVSQLAKAALLVRVVEGGRGPAGAQQNAVLFSLHGEKH